MDNYTVKSIDEMEAIFHGAFKLAGAELGIGSFGLQVIDIPAGSEHYPDHDHNHDRQEEVFLALRGSAEFVIEGEKVALDPDRIVRISPSAKRKLTPGPEGVRLVALGGVPGEAYDRPEPFRLKAAATADA